MKARINVTPLDDQPTFFEKELIDLMTDETSAWTKFLQPEFGTWSEGIKRASLDAIAPLPIDPYKEMMLDECRIWLSWLENVFRMLNVKIREAEDDEVYTCQTCLRESRRQEAALSIYENTDPSAPPIEVRSMSSHSHATDTMNDSRCPSLPSYFNPNSKDHSLNEQASQTRE
ncbi:hypothetical protein H257_13140 [Aphanomyces astaci]|uniref:Uncharacterized protein n=1 Tax=Aphanomyces astaci TaxID=112090 RepID=W4FW07_APHAT|nr:hypothetical protein H257_13140 [Aphanomyces astaci]ETV71710.1 hypothetical protein H257_13140 [Aphanomyces astaci]|eukprot:XP_009838898.1 hypothetical protein H257_13140 [Aphanomyces astaci]